MIKPQNLEEKVVWYTIIGTYGLYFLGALHLVIPAIAWFLGFYLCIKLWQQTETTPTEERIKIPLGVWVWIMAMLVIEVALVMGHLDFGMADRLGKSTINFFVRTWALLALFPLIGCLKIRPQLIYRAVCILCLQCLFFIGVGYAAVAANLPEPLFLSPLYKIGGVGELYYNVTLYGFDGETENESVRLVLFTPWAPALGLVGNIYFWLTSQESNPRWRWMGMVSSVAMVFVSVSRLGLLSLVVVPVLVWLLGNLARPSLQITSGVICFLGGLFGSQVLDLLQNFREGFDRQRRGSSNVRAMLARISLERWWNEAPIWGHGILEPRGPEATTYKPIGSHHLWFGLLFTHGIVGFLAVAFAMSWSFIDLLIKVKDSRTAQIGLAILLVLFLFSFAENLEVIAYVYWPGLIILGLALNEKRELISSKKVQGLSLSQG
ncbi:MAG: O-antigen ligase family protein [Leptolyngbyaceae bacterium]|nr:O-antigen ligase family protein [Leptolyngbyaceae bacterium]